jgi:hypothetical protein
VSGTTGTFSGNVTAPGITVPSITTGAITGSTGTFSGNIDANAGLRIPYSQALKSNSNHTIQTKMLDAEFSKPFGLANDAIYLYAPGSTSGSASPDYVLGANAVGIKLPQTTNATSVGTGALQVAGGGSFGGDVHVGGSIVGGNVSYNNTSSGTFHVTNNTGRTLRVDSTEQSTSNTTGCATFSGGVGISGNVHIGGTLTGGSISYSTTSTGTLDITNSPGTTLNVDSVEQSNNISTGAVVVDGGVAVKKRLCVGEDILVGETPLSGGRIVDIANTSSNSGAASVLRLRNGGTPTALLFLNGTNRSDDGGVNTLTLRNDAGVVRLQAANTNGIIITNDDVQMNKLRISDTTQSTSTTTGGVTVPGGVGIAKNVTIGEQLTVSGSSTLATVSAGAITASGAYTGTSAVFSGSVTTPNLIVPSLTTGAISGTTGSFSGNVTADSISIPSLSTGAITATTGTYSGTITAPTVTTTTLNIPSLTTGSVSGTTGNFSGLLTATGGLSVPSLSTGTISGSTGTFTGNVTAPSVTTTTLTTPALTTGSINGTTGTFTGNLTVSGSTTLSTLNAVNLNLVNDSTSGADAIINASNNTVNSIAILRFRNHSGSDAVIFKNSALRTDDGGVNTLTIRNDAGTVRLQSSNQNGVTATTSGLSLIGAVSLENTNQSTSTTTGSLVTPGGVGVVKNIYGGGNLNITGDTVLSGTVTTGALFPSAITTGTIACSSLAASGGITAATGTFSGNVSGDNSLFNSGRIQRTGSAQLAFFNNGNQTEWFIGQRSNTDHNFKIVSFVGGVETENVEVLEVNRQGLLRLGGITKPFFDYDEGVWTPTVTATGNTPNLNYSLRSGWFVRVGKMVTVGFNIGYGYSYAGGASYILITGLPSALRQTRVNINSKNMETSIAGTTRPADVVLWTQSFDLLGVAIMDGLTMSPGGYTSNGQFVASAFINGFIDNQNIHFSATYMIA